jgi:hypothetical protein
MWLAVYHKGIANKPFAPLQYIFHTSSQSCPSTLPLNTLRLCLGAPSISKRFSGRKKCLGRFQIRSGTAKLEVSNTSTRHQIPLGLRNKRMSPRQPGCHGCFTFWHSLSIASSFSSHNSTQRHALLASVVSTISTCHSWRDLS